MNLLRDDTWKRRGVSMLWCPALLESVISPDQVVSMRGFFHALNSLGDELPGSNGNSLVVAGLDAVLDAVSPKDAEVWLEGKLRPAVFHFQEHFGGQAALIFWIPSGKTRIPFSSATDSYFWECASPYHSVRVDFGRCVFGGAASDVSRIVSSDPKDDPDSKGWLGLYIARIS